MPAPALIRRDPPDRTRGIVLMLHGGAKTGLDPVTGRSLSLRRTTAMRDVLAPHVLGEGLSVWLLRFGVRGWNAESGREPSPVPDARWALDQCAEEHPGVPVVLLGHSMGARTAVHVADHPSVAGVVALAPWLERTDPVRHARGTAPHRRARPPGPDHLGRDDQGLRRPGAQHRGLGGVRRPRSVGSLHAPAGRGLEPVRAALDADRVRSGSQHGMTGRRRWLTRGNVLNHLRGRHLRRRAQGLDPGRRAVRADRPGQLLGCDRPAGDRNRLRRQHRGERVGDQPLRPDARRRHRRLRADLRPGRHSPAPRHRRHPDDRRGAGGSAGAQLRDPARRPDHPGRRSRGRAHAGRGDHQRALLRIRPGDGPRPGRRLRRGGELRRAAGRWRSRGPARLARGDRPADARNAAACPCSGARCRPRAAAPGWT